MSLKQWPTEKINRSQINFADYNPRILSASTRKKLKANLDKMGLMGGIVWNKRTGNVVSGHQRLGIIDQINKTKDYELECVVVDIDLEDEKKQNIFFNNYTAQGEYDLEKLNDMMKDLGYSEDTGFLKQEQMTILGIKEQITAEEFEQEVAEVEKIRELLQTIGNTNKDNTVDDFYVVLVFKNKTEKEVMLSNVGLEDNKFQVAQQLFDAVAESVAKRYSKE
jgi:uncharacterized membrane protein YciS (DUF1049 family)